MQEYLDDLKRVFRWFKQNEDPNGINELCEMRGYFSDEMKNFLRDYGVIKLREGVDVGVLKNLKSDLGLFSDKGNFLLEDRFIIPLKDLEGNILTFIGWYPDERKYVTVKTPFFSKNLLLFGLDNFNDERIVVVEGIFDCLSLRAWGIPAVAVMGSDCSVGQRGWLSLCKEVLAIPDNDYVGRSVVKRDKWGVKDLGGLYVVWWGLEAPKSDGEKIEVKDIDTLCMLFDPKDALGDIEYGGIKSVVNLNE